MIATLNLNGDYVSMPWRRVGGIGIAPGANLSDLRWPASRRPTARRRNTPARTGVNPVPKSSAEMMLRHWPDRRGRPVISAMEKAILSKKVTYDFARLDGGRDGAVPRIRPGDDDHYVTRPGPILAAGER